MHPDPGARALDQRLGELLADRAAPPDVALEGDGVLGAADRLEHRREDLVAVDELLHAVADQEARPEDRAHGAAELGVRHRIERLDALVDALVAKGEIDDQQHDQRGRDEDRRDARFHAARQVTQLPGDFHAPRIVSRLCYRRTSGAAMISSLARRRRTFLSWWSIRSTTLGVISTTLPGSQSRVSTSMSVIAQVSSSITRSATWPISPSVASMP